MRVRALDASHDWTFGRGRQNYLTKSEAIAQNVVTRLLSFRADWFLDLDHGLPWFEMMERKRIEPLVKQQVLQTEGVQYLTDFDLVYDPQTRKVKINLTYVDVFGEENKVNERLS